MKLNSKITAILFALTLLLTTCSTQTYANTTDDYGTKCDKETRELIHKTITFTESLVKIKDENKIKIIEDIPYDETQSRQTFGRMSMTGRLGINCELLSKNKDDLVAKYIKIIHTTSHEQYHNFSFGIRRSILTGKEVDFNGYWNMETEYNIQFLTMLFSTNSDNIVMTTSKRVQGAGDMYNGQNEETQADAFADYVLSTKQVQEMLKRVYKTCPDICINPSDSSRIYEAGIKQKVTNGETFWLRWYDVYLNMSYNLKFKKYMEKEVIPFINKYVGDDSMGFNESKTTYIKTIESSGLNNEYNKERITSDLLSKKLVPSPFSK